MIGLIKFSFYVFVAALTGLVATSIPFGGKTLSTRVSDWWTTPAVQRAVVDAEKRVEHGVDAAKKVPKEIHDAKSKAEVDRIVARRAPADSDKDHRRQAPPRGN